MCEISHSLTKYKAWKTYSRPVNSLFNLCSGKFRAACLGQSKRAFISKLGIVIEEADECIFWIEFAHGENLLVDIDHQELLNEARELTSILIASRITDVRNLKPE